MCKTKMKMDLYCVNICKYEHENNMTRLCCKIMFKINIEQIEENERSYFYLYPFGTQMKEAFKEAFRCALNKKNFLKMFLTKCQL